MSDRTDHNPAAGSPDAGNGADRADVNPATRTEGAPGPVTTPGTATPGTATATAAPERTTTPATTSAGTTNSDTTTPGTSTSGTTKSDTATRGTTSPGKSRPSTAAAEPAISESTLRAALSTRTRPPRPSGVTASLIFGWRAMLKIRHVPMQLFDVTVFPIMFVLMFTYLFGGALADSPREYLQFLLPGILVQTVAWITIYTGMGLNSDIHKGVFDRFRSLPVWRPALLVGMLLADVARYTMATVIMLALGLALGFRPDGGPVGVVAAVALLLLFSFALSWLWTVLGMKMQTPEAVMQTSMTVMFPLTFASNVFVDPDTMPGWVQAFVNHNPITHLTSAIRDLMHGSPAGTEIAWVLGWSIGLVLVFAPLAMRLYNAER
ncbi:MAG TPA: ABC transporter permease [Acidimicrobiales bacterium]|nr:ABC transporter permease [Acidimicrobiales bacterium]